MELNGVTPREFVERVEEGYISFPVHHASKVIYQMIDASGNIVGQFDSIDSQISFLESVNSIIRTEKMGREK